MLSHSYTTGSRAIDKREIPSMKVGVDKGVSLLEGSFPVGHLHPALKHLLHYGKQTGDTGLLDWLSMFCFERNNKQVKHMVKSASHPLASLANHVEINILTRLELLSNLTADDVRAPVGPRLAVPVKRYVLADRERNDITLLGVTSLRQCKAFKVCKVLGVHFRAGGWGNRRCGSVITTIYRGISRYCIVHMFLQVQGRVFACVRWLSTPVYPCLPFKLVVKVRVLTPVQQRVHRSVIPVERIDSCTVAVLPDSDGVHFFMMRDKGTDRTPSP